MRHTDLRKRWFQRLSRLKPNLSLAQVAEAVGEKYAAVAFWCRTFGYPYICTTRGRKCTINWDSIDWSQRNCVLARQLGITSERIRQVRIARNLPPIRPRSPNRLLFREFITLNHERVRNVSPQQIVAESGIDIGLVAAKEVLRQCGIGRRRCGIPWRAVNWELSDGDLAALWSTDSIRVARMRRVHGGKSPRWEVADTSRLDSPEYKQTTVAEVQKAHACGRL